MNNYRSKIIESLHERLKNYPIEIEIGSIADDIILNCNLENIDSITRACGLVNKKGSKSEKNI